LRHDTRLWSRRICQQNHRATLGAIRNQRSNRRRKRRFSIVQTSPKITQYRIISMGNRGKVGDDLGHKNSFYWDGVFVVFGFIGLRLLSGFSAMGA
jgi:hypothetical protein